MTSAKYKRAIILTALPLEYQAVRSFMDDPLEVTHKGTVYETGKFSALKHTWTILLAEIGAGNNSAAFEAERAINFFNPFVALFIGVAGGIKDVRIGDVVIGNKVYGYESGKEKDGFNTRPDVGQGSYSLIQRARAEIRSKAWIKRITLPRSTTPQAFIGPIAAGEKVVASTESALFKFLKSSYGDSLAVEMEGRGFLSATHANPSVESIIIRGISDLIDNKSGVDDALRQEIAANHASAFGFELLSKL